MNYSCQEEYDYHMGSEAEAEAEQVQNYQQYLSELSTNDPYLFALEMAQDFYTSPDFKKSGLAFDVFIQKLKEIRMEFYKQEHEEKNTELPF